MKKSALCIVLLLACLCNVIALAEDDVCYHAHINVYDDDDYWYVIPALVGGLGHTRYHTRYTVCMDCSESWQETISEAQLHTYSFAYYANVEAGHNTTHHWEIGDEVLACACDKTKEGEENVQYLYEAHYSNNATGWIDAGHSGVVHYYDKICSRSTCRVQYRWRTISCPGGTNHIAPTSIVTPPLVTE